MFDNPLHRQCAQTHVPTEPTAHRVSNLEGAVQRQAAAHGLASSSRSKAQGCTEHKAAAIKRSGSIKNVPIPDSNGRADPAAEQPVASVLITSECYM
jgi:hypothetical protein